MNWKDLDRLYNEAVRDPHNLDKRIEYLSLCNRLFSELPHPNYWDEDEDKWLDSITPERLEKLIYRLEGAAKRQLDCSHDPDVELNCTIDMDGEICMKYEVNTSCHCHPRMSKREVVFSINEIKEEK